MLEEWRLQIRLPPRAGEAGQLLDAPRGVVTFVQQPVAEQKVSDLVAREVTGVRRRGIEEP